MTPSGERDLSVDAAVALGLEVARATGVTLSFRTFGGSLQTAECVLSDQNGRTAIGTGKGVGAQTIASALYESFEHYHYARSLEMTGGGADIRPLSFAGPDNYLLEASPRFSLFTGLEETPVTRTRFFSLSNASSVEYPTFLTNPKFVSSSSEEEEWLARTRARRYSTNSGVASGATRDEAILHGLLELIERDALSLELLKTIFVRDAHASRRIDRQTLPWPVEQLLLTLERETGGSVTLWNISSDVRVAVVLARLQLSDSPSDTYFGSGASLDPQHATRRAVLEALQGHHVFSFIRSRPAAPEPAYLSRKSNYHRALLECGVFDIRGGTADVSFASLPFGTGEHASTHLRAQISMVVQLLDTVGVASYSRDINAGPISVVHTLAPQLERFFLVSVGLIVAPGGRGARLLDRRPRA